MSRRAAGLWLAGLMGLTSCTGLRTSNVDPRDPAITAQIESALERTMEAAAQADADRVLAVAAGETDLTFVVGDVMLNGFDNIKDVFHDTYSSVLRQDHTVLRKDIRVLTPEVAVLSMVGEGTYTDVGGVTSQPFGLGITLVFVKRDGEWRVTHVHQSVLD
jgi:uncharacterized protein (TIGR02246 family)